MTAPERAAHSSLVGGSSAGRRMDCPGSYQLEGQIPTTAQEEESPYAAEGTALHEAIAYILREGVTEEELFDTIVGMEFYGYVMTTEMVKDALVPAVQFFDKLCDQLETDDGGEFEFEIECKVQMPGIPGAFGTADIIGKTPMRSVCVDWKFGAGVPVYAYKEVPYTDDKGAAKKKVGGNPQQMFYSRGGAHSLPDMFEQDDDWPVELFICQPRISEDMGKNFSHYSTTMKELEEFRMELVRAITEAASNNPRVAEQEGPHCRWCTARPICPTHTGPKLDLTKLDDAEAMEPDNTNELDNEVYCEMLGEIIAKGAILEEMVKEAKQQAVVMLEAGFEIPNPYGEGFGLKPKRKGHDKWLDDAKAEKHLANLGLSVEERRVVKPLTPAAARKALKGIDKKLRESYVQVGTSSGYTLDALENIKEPVTFPRAGHVAEQLAKLPDRE